MKCMVSKVMVHELNEYFKDKPPFNKYKFEYTEFEPLNYKWYVGGDYWNNSQDWKQKTGTFKVIKVVYPEEYYACSNYLTTNDLTKCCQRANRIYERFMREVANEIEI